jgi:hypothetical protein
MGVLRVNSKRGRKCYNLGMKKFIDPVTQEITDHPVNKDGYIYKVKKPDGSDFSENDELYGGVYGPALIVSEKVIN